MYHWEADQEDFLVLSGEGLLLVEGEERPLRAWDFVHCPPNTNHIILGAGDEPCVVVAVGARDKSVAEDESWGGYPGRRARAAPRGRRRGSDAQGGGGVRERHPPTADAVPPRLAGLAPERAARRDEFDSLRRS